MIFLNIGNLVFPPSFSIARPLQTKDLSVLGCSSRVFVVSLASLARQDVYS
jgi:hypothetical protein